MRIFFIPLLVSVFLVVTSGCDKNSSKIVLSKSDCERNWAVCTIFESKKIDTSDKGEIVKIAILDSGIDKTHETLKNQVKKSYNAISNQHNTRDSFGHGTAIAGIIAAKRNDENVTGVFPASHLYDVKVLDKNGSGKIEDVVKGIRWSIEQKVDIINLSFGFQKDSKDLKQAIDDALSNGIIIVAAAGNTFGLYTDYPAKYPGVISVSAVNEKLNHYSLAAAGKIDIVAPGVEIPIIGMIRGEKQVSGTSFAAAYATGVIAYALANGSNNSDVIRSKFVSLKELDNKKYNGQGLLYIP